MELYKICDQKLQYLRYSENTSKIYLHFIDEFLQKIGKHYTRINSSDLKQYLNNYNYSSGSQQNQVISALKFMWMKCLGKKYIKVDFKRPRGDKKLPRVIDMNLLIDRINEIKNLKHKAILSIGASVGLRVSEVINLKISDIDSDRMIINVRNGKGRKDRIVPLSEKLLNTLREYFKIYKPKTYLFNGQDRFNYSPGSCNKIIKKYIGEGLHFHLLRHSCFTYLAEKGVDISIIQKIAGHTSIKTTTIYLHLSNKSLKSLPLPI